MNVILTASWLNPRKNYIDELEIMHAIAEIFDKLRHACQLNTVHDPAEATAPDPGTPVALMSCRGNIR
jgi:hypothetical protein